MTDTSTSMSVSAAPKSPERTLRLQARYTAERRFRFYGRAAIAIAAGILIFLLSSIVYNSIPAFTQNFVELDIELAQDIIDPNFSNDSEIMVTPRILCTSIITSVISSKLNSILKISFDGLG